MDNISVSHEFVKGEIFNYVDKFSEKFNVDKRDVENLVIRLKKVVKEHKDHDNERVIEGEVILILRELDTTIDSGNIPDKQLVGLEMIPINEISNYNCNNLCMEKTCSKYYKHFFTINLFGVMVHIPLCEYHFDIIFEISRFFRYMYMRGGEKYAEV